jgi:hypothetical protein
MGYWIKNMRAGGYDERQARLLPRVMIYVSLSGAAGYHRSNILLFD